MKKRRITPNKMDSIVGIIDMDGFQIEKIFYCKEIGMLGIEKEEGLSIIFDLNLNWSDLTPKQQKECMFLTKNIHKLPFKSPSEVKTFEISKLELIVKEFYNRIKINNQSTIAYKGGHYERDLLNKLKIPSVNLEIFGCPKAKQLFKRLVWLETCGHHLGEHSYEHCPKVEVEAFGGWLREKMMK